MATIGFQTNSDQVPQAIVPLNDFKHALFIGRTGSGKTSGAVYPLIDSRMSAGHGMLIFDEKGKEHKAVKVFAHRHGRLNDVLEIGKPHGIRINLLHEMSTRQLERFVNQLIQGNDNWMIGAVNMFLETIQWLRAIKSFYHFSINAFDLDEYPLSIDQGSEIHDKKAIKLIHTVSTEPLTLTELSHYFKITVDYTMICQLGHEFSEIIADKIKSKLSDITQIDDQLKQNLHSADIHFEQLEKLSGKIKGYRIKVDASEASGNNGLYFMICSTIGSFANEKYINDPYGKDLAELLNKGKIIVVNTESFGDAVLTGTLTKTLASLTVRAKLKNVQPISVIIDEANRILTSDTDLFVDILRESRVEIIMATQNHEQMNLKMGNVKWASFSGNFNTRFLFLGPSTTRQGYHDVLDERTDQEMEAKAIFLRDNELNQVELEYQKMDHFYDQYKQSKNEISIYDHLLYERKNAILIQNLASGEMREVILQEEIKKIKSNRFHSYAESMIVVNHTLTSIENDKGALTQITDNFEGRLDSALNL